MDAVVFMFRMNRGMAMPESYIPRSRRTLGGGKVVWMSRVLDRMCSYEEQMEEERSW